MLLVFTISGAIGLLAAILLGICIAIAIGNPLAGTAVAWLVWEVWKWTKPTETTTPQGDPHMPRVLDRRPSAMDD